MLTRLLSIRPIVCVQAKKDNFVEPADAPGEGGRRFPNSDELGTYEDHPKKDLIKKFLVEIFKIKEIDYEKFEKENMWAIRPEHKDKDP